MHTNTRLKTFTLQENETPEQFVIRRLQEAATTLHRLPDKGYRQTFSRSAWSQAIDEKPDDKLFDGGTWTQKRVDNQGGLPSYFSPSPRAIDGRNSSLAFPAG